MVRRDVQVFAGVFAFFFVSRGGGGSRRTTKRFGVGLTRGASSLACFFHVFDQWVG